MKMPGGGGTLIGGWYPWDFLLLLLLYVLPSLSATMGCMLTPQTQIILAVVGTTVGF